MSSFSQTIEPRYDVSTYEGVRDNYNWIINSARELSNEELKINADFLFYIGKIRCSSSSIEEFTDQCYGINDFKLISFQIFVYKQQGGHIFSAIYLSDLDIYADSRKSLEQVITILNHTSSQDTNQDNTCNIVKNEYHNVGVVVNGDNNTVANNNSAVANNNSSIADNGSSVNDSSQKESAIKRWIESIAQNLTASLIWKLIPLIGIAIITYIVSKIPS